MCVQMQKYCLRWYVFAVRSIECSSVTASEDLRGFGDCRFVPGQPWQQLPTKSTTTADSPKIRPYKYEKSEKS
jgi:hypothetical protein